MPDKANIEYLKIALQLAEKGRGKTAPNPMVGAVIAKNGRIISTGFHRKAGSDHAEITAIKNAKENIKGAVLYVTLEPCCHTGRTGPCTDAIINSGISKIVTCTKDPNPLVNGRGIRRLKKAGIEVTTGILKNEAFELNDAYFSYFKNERPFVTLKLAQTIDGRIAVLSGESKYISSKPSLDYVHSLRAGADAIVVGMETVKKDNPSLTVRNVKGNNPYRIVISNSLKFGKNSKLLTDNSDFKTIIATTEKSQQKFSKTKSGKNLIYWNLKSNSNGQIDLSDFIEKANAFGIRSILVEGGAKLATSFLKAGLVDKMITVTAPMILGHGINGIEDLKIRSLNKAITFKNHKTFKSGADTIFVGYPKYEKK